MKPAMQRAFAPTRVVNIKHREPYDVYVGRAVEYRHDLKPLGWGNPWHRWNSESEAPLARYVRRTLLPQLRQPAFVERLRALQGKTLACWCVPKGGTEGDLVHPICHAQILAAMADLLVLVERQNRLDESGNIP